MSLQVYSEHICGGSILDEIHILTAAHCVISDTNEITQPRDLEIVTGTVDTEERRDDNVFAVYDIMVHSYYSPGGSYPADVALIKVKSIAQKKILGSSLQSTYFKSDVTVSIQEKNVTINNFNQVG